jgi:hypothetical protein
VGAEGEADALRRRQVLVDRVEGGVERVGPFAHGRVEQVLLRRDVRVERALLHAHRLGQVADGRPVVAPLREEAGRLPG